jgi:hypothetical protein
MVLRVCDAHIAETYAVFAAVAPPTSPPPAPPPLPRPHTRALIARTCKRVPPPPPPPDFIRDNGGVCAAADYPYTGLLPPFKRCKSGCAPVPGTVRDSLYFLW